MSSGFLSSEFFVMFMGLFVGPSGILLLLADKLPQYGIVGVIGAQLIIGGAAVLKYITERSTLKSGVQQSTKPK